MAVETARLGFPPIISWRTTPSSPRTLPMSSKSFRRRQRLHAIFASLAEEEREISFTEPEAALVDALIGIQGRGRAAPAQQHKEVERAVEALENLKGLPDPTNSNLIEGCWQLMYTTRPGTSSPIQRTFVGVDTFTIFQEVYLRTNDPRVANIVQFSNQIGQLKVEAAATVKDGKRILFQFDRAFFSFKFLPFKVPYPVPFRLLGDEAKGWLDTTYLSTCGIIRISRGNKESDGNWQVAAANGLKGLQIVKKNGNLENNITLFPGFRLCDSGIIAKSEGNKFKATINTRAYLAGSMRFPVEIKSSYCMELLYIDKKIRITRQNEDIMLIHLRISNP